MSSKHAAALGRLGGLKRTDLKSSAARMNGQRGGRPAIQGLSDREAFFDAVDEARHWFHFEALFNIYRKSKRPRERALIESPTYFRTNNIFVLGNFLNRA